MTEQRPRNRLLTAGNLLSIKDIKDKSRDLKKTNSCQYDKSPIKKGQSLLKTLNIREKI